MNRPNQLAGIMAILLAGAPVHAAQQLQQRTTYEIDSSRSKMEIDVYREGFFKAFGHDHLVAAKEFSGQVLFDANKVESSATTFRVATKSLTVIDPGESEKDRNSVQTTMRGKEVLDVEHFPEVTFSSNGESKAERKGEKWNFTLAGKLKLHGVEKPVYLPVIVSLVGNELVAQGELSLLQTEYGITPVKVAGGAVKVKDRLRIRFEMHGRSQ